VTLIAQTAGELMTALERDDIVETIYRYLSWE